MAAEYGSLVGAVHGDFAAALIQRALNDVQAHAVAVALGGEAGDEGGRLGL